MANKIQKELFQGAKGLDPSYFVAERDLSNIHVGIEHGPTGTVYNRMALPWAGGAYTLVEGDWRKVAGRDGALSGPAMEEKYGNLTQVWRQFASAQGAREDNPGTFESLVADQRRVAERINEVGEKPESESNSLRGLKLTATRDGSMSDLPAVTDGGRPVEEE